MNFYPRSRPLKFVCLLLLGLVLAGSQARAQGGGDDYYDDEETDVKEFATVMLQVDERGGAKVTVSLAAKPGDSAALKQSLADALGFPVQVDNERAVDYDEEDAHWWYLQGHNDQAFPRRGMVSGGRVDVARLLGAFRRLGIKDLSLMLYFPRKAANLRVDGADKFSAPDMSGLGDLRGDLAELVPEVYTLKVRTDEPAPPAVGFSWGYRGADLARQSAPLLLFLLAPVLLTLWVSSSVLRMKGAEPLAVWGRYYRYLYWLMNGVWLAWLPTYSLANVPELISAVGAQGIAAEVIGLALYFLPPLAVLYLCHLLSRGVYGRVRGAEWSPREVVGKVILSNIVMLTPFFFSVLALNMFAARSRYAGLMVVSAVVTWALFAGLAGKAFNRAAYAVESGELRDRIFALAERAGVRLKQIYVLPEARAQLSNAFARSDNSVMLTASLLRHLSRREVDAVMAHEVGHLKEKHPQTLGRVSLITIVCANLVASLLASAVNVQRWTPALFSLSIIASMLVTHFLSRGNERHADSISVNLTGDPEAFITGLARMSRLNLMPLHGGGWSESLGTHPATRRRLEDVARWARIPPERFEWLLNAPAPAAEERYDVAQLSQGVEGKVFSTAFKGRNVFRISWAMLAVVVVTPVLLALATQSLALRGLPLWAAFACGLGLTLCLYHLIRNFAAFWGYDSLKQQLRAKLKRAGFDEAARDGVFVGFAPAARPTSYENYLFWDAGLLHLTGGQLRYVGEETQFALGRSDIEEIYLGDSHPLWIRQKHLYVRWRDRERGTSGTFYLLSAEARSLLQARRKVKALHARLREWLGGDQTGAAAEPSPALGRPAYSVVTGQDMRERLNGRAFVKNTVLLLFFSLLLGMGARLSLAGLAYAAGVVVCVCLLDRLPGLFRSASERAAPRQDGDGAAESPIEVRPLPQQGAWAESES